ncbi:MAG: proton-conducting transporter membrane subunit, partial [Prochlorothrix sp.]|nr:proton-conducting transporter membrane subunit [Prochlorothrix sp.]
TLSPWVTATLIGVGGITAIGASLVAIAQIDIKRTLSHSTSAYLGLVFVAVGLEHGDIALLLLLTHAIAKSLLFMSSGSIIFITSNQDITEMGGLWSRMPATTLAFVVGSLGLLPLLPLGMFWTLYHWVNGVWTDPNWLIGLLMLVNSLSAINLLRVFRLVFLGEVQPKTRRAPEANWAMAVPMVSLTIVTLLLPLMLERWQSSLRITSPVVDQSGWQDWAFLLIMGATVLGLAIAAALTLSGTLSRPINRPTRFIQDLLAYDFYIDRIYRVTVVWAVEQCSRLAAWIDRYVIDGFVNAVGLATLLSGQGLKYSASGQSQLYVVTIILGLVTLLVLLIGVAPLSESLSQVLKL